MTEPRISVQRRLALYGTGTHPCAYLPERTAATQFVDPHSPLSTGAYSVLVEQGFRRSGQYLYRPDCPACSACQSLRIPVGDLQLRRRHRRCLRRNAGVEIQRVPPGYDPSHFELYRRYVSQRHPGGEMDDPDPRKYLEFLTAPWCNTGFYEFREDGRLLAVSVVDELPAGLSAVYTFYDPAFEPRGLGMLAILWLHDYAQRLGLPHLYLGYWIADCGKMAYKAEYRPHEVFRHGRWEWVA